MFGKKQPVLALNGRKFEYIMNNLPAERRNGDTASTIMLVAEVTEIPNTVVEDLVRESEMRQNNADSHHETAENLRAQANIHDSSENAELYRKERVDELRGFLP